MPVVGELPIVATLAEIGSFDGSPRVSGSDVLRTFLYDPLIPLSTTGTRADRCRPVDPTAGVEHKIGTNVGIGAYFERGEVPRSATCLTLASSLGGRRR